MKSSPIVAALLLMFASSAATAADATGSLIANANVSTICTIAAPSILAFGNYDPTGAHRSATLTVAGSIDVKCTNGTGSLVVYINKGQNDVGGCGAATRRMKGTSPGNLSSYLNYTIQRTSPTGGNWGCTLGSGTNGGVGVGPFTNGQVPISVNAYGSIAAGQTTAAVGNYADLLSVYVNF